MKTLLVVLCLLSQTLLAAGTFKLKGTLRSFSPNAFEIFDGHKIYSISVEALPMELQKQVRAAKTGAKLEIDVPFQGVLNVRAPASN